MVAGDFPGVERTVRSLASWSGQPITWEPSRTSFVRGQRIYVARPEDVFHLCGHVLANTDALLLDRFVRNFTAHPRDATYQLIYVLENIRVVTWWNTMFSSTYHCDAAVANPDSAALHLWNSVVLGTCTDKQHELVDSLLGQPSLAVCQLVRSLPSEWFAVSQAFPAALRDFVSITPTDKQRLRAERLGYLSAKGNGIEVGVTIKAEASELRRAWTASTTAVQGTVKFREPGVVVRKPPSVRPRGKPLCSAVQVLARQRERSLLRDCEGTEVDPSAIANYRVCQDTSVFKKHPNKRKDLTVLVDLSHSMRPRVHTLGRAVEQIQMTLKYPHFSTRIWGFNSKDDGTVVLSKWDQGIPKSLVEQVEGATPLHAALGIYRRSQKSIEADKILVVLSDGSPYYATQEGVVPQDQLEAICKKELRCLRAQGVRVAGGLIDPDERSLRIFNGIAYSLEEATFDTDFVNLVVSLCLQETP